MDRIHVAMKKICVFDLARLIDLLVTALGQIRSTS